VTLYYARVDDGGGGWIEFDFNGDLNNASGTDASGNIHFTGDYGSGEVLLAWDTDLLTWYVNDLGDTFAGPTTRCDATGLYELSAFEISLTPFS
jgi:hypothetical protein